MFVSQNWEIKWSWFPGPGGANAKEGVPTYYLANFFPQNCMRIKENWAKSKRGAFPAFCQIWRRIATCELGRLETVLLYFLFLLVNHWMVPRYNLQRWTTSKYFVICYYGHYGLLCQTNINPKSCIAFETRDHRNSENVNF